MRAADQPDASNAARKAADLSSWSSRLAALRYIPAFLGVVWQAHRGYFFASVAARLVRACVPLAVLWVGKLIIDEIIAATTRTDPNLVLLWQYVALEIAIVVLGELLARLTALVESLLGDRVALHLSVRIMEHAAQLDLEQLENPTVHDHLERARQQTAGDRLGLFSQLLAIAQDIITLATLAAALLSYSVWLCLLLIISVAPRFLAETHFGALEYSMLFRFTPERRELNYVRLLAASEKTAKEVQMFGLAGWLTERYKLLAEHFYGENKRLATRKSVISSLLSVLGVGGYYTAYITIVLGAVGRTISIGQLTLLGGSFSRSRDLVQSLLLAASNLSELGLYLRDLFTFFDLQPQMHSNARARLAPRFIRTGVAFEDVGFRYPGDDRWALRHVSFHVSPRECIAIVGENGAGKTTLTKLLARLYDPTEGRITLDGVDLRDYNVESIRQNISVIFQDFVRYDMRLDENIAVGHINSVRSYIDARSAGRFGSSSIGDFPVPIEIRVAAEQSLASTLVDEFPGGYQQMLGRMFAGGVALSGGEWQKVALARAYIRMRVAQLVILDEPTAALDARAEYQIFERFRDLSRSCMSVLISHRFSTVRIADRILVLEDGVLIETGTHRELIDMKGLYAELFGMQAAAYQ